MAHIYENESSVDTTNVTIVTLSLVFIYLIGLYLQIKIIIISKQDKDMTWRIDISHSIVMIIYYTFQILFETITHVIPNLSHFTGSWFCYFALFVKLYGMASIVGHSLVIAIHKYIFIMHGEIINNFGKEKAKKIALWINVFLPSVWAMSWMVRPHYSIASVNMCHGSWIRLQESSNEVNETASYTPGKLAETFFFCGMGDYDGYSSFDYFIYVASQGYCFFQTVVSCIVVGNIIEIFFYKRIFNYMKR